MTMHALPLPTLPQPMRMLGLVGRSVLRLVNLMRAYKHHRDMQLLASFDERMLRDIGLTPGDIRDAVAEPLWRDPTSVLVKRVRERRSARGPLPADGSHLDAPPTAPDIDDWSSRQFPARSRYY